MYNILIVSEKLNPAPEGGGAHLHLTEAELVVELKNLTAYSTCVMTICRLPHRKPIKEIIVVSF